MLSKSERDFFAVNLVERVGDRAKGVMQKLGFRKEVQVNNPTQQGHLSSDHINGQQHNTTGSVYDQSGRSNPDVPYGSQS